MNAVLEFPPPTKERPKMDLKRDEARMSREDGDHELLIRMDQKLISLREEIGEFKANFARRLTSVEEDVADLKTKQYATWLVVFVLFSLLGLYASWHK